MSEIYYRYLLQESNQSQFYIDYLLHTDHSTFSDRSVLSTAVSMDAVEAITLLRVSLVVVIVVVAGGVVVAIILLSLHPSV